MKFTLIPLGAAAMTSIVQATAILDSCNVSHATDGNTFTVNFSQVADGSEKTICGAAANSIKNAASSFSTNVLESIKCSTSRHTPNQSTMTLTVKFGKQPPGTQLDALVNGLTAGFGTAGVSTNDRLCNLSGIPQ